jgi:uncharacterized protein YneF (UPF0154 family)
MRNIRQFVTGGLLGVAAVTAQAQAMKPGLWEISNKMLGGSGEMQAAMAEMQKEMENMPPEERKMMQDMMAKHGASISPSGAAMSVKICLTQEMINRNQINRQEGNCRHNLSPKVGNSMKFSVACSDPVASGEGVITFISPTAYDTSMTLKTTQNGQPETMKMASSSRFLSANCGSILPIVVPAK